MKKIINAFDTGEDGNRIAVIQYSTTVREEIGLVRNIQSFAMYFLLLCMVILMMMCSSINSPL